MTVIENAVSLTSLNVDVSQALVLVMTLCTAIIFGMAVLRRPSRATVVWGLAFGLGLLGSYVWVAAIQIDLPQLRALAVGLMLCFEPLIWMGLRLFAGRKTNWAPVVMFVALVPVVLALTADTEAFATFFRVCFAATGVFACLIALDLARLRTVSRDVVIPLLLGSGALAIVAVLNVVWNLVAPSIDPALRILVLRDVNGLGSVVINLCALVTILLLVRSDHEVATGKQFTADDTVIRMRVGRVRDQQETAWSLLDVRLDDTADLREASSQADFGAILERFQADVMEALPPAADIVPMSDRRILALLNGSEQAIEHYVRTVLDRVSSVDVRENPGAVRMSASIGWAAVLEARFDYDSLVELAGERAERAAFEGGDRWERARRGTVTMAIKTVRTPS